MTTVDYIVLTAAVVALSLFTVFEIFEATDNLAKGIFDTTPTVEVEYTDFDAKFITVESEENE